MKKHKKSKLMSIWGLSYFLLLGLFVASIISVSLVSQSVNRKINNKYCQSLFGGISQNVTETVGKSNLLYFTLVNYRGLDEILAVKNIGSYYLEPAVSGLIDDLRVMKGNVDFYIYIPKTDTVLADNGFFKSEVYHKVVLSDYGISYEEWMEQFRSGGPKGMISGSNTESGDIFIREKYSTKDGEQLYFVTKINENALLSVDELPEWISDSDIYISNISGEIYMSRGNAKRIAKCENTSSVRAVYNDKWEVFSKTEFSTLPIVVTIVYPRKAAWTELNFLVRLQVIMCVALVLISLMVILFMLRRNYKPIVSIMKLLNAENSGDELGGIQSRIHELLNMNKYYSQQVKKYVGENTQNVIAKCLSGNYSHSTVLRMLRENQISFPHKHFTLCAFDIKDLSELFKEDGEKLSEQQKLNELTFIFHNIFSELFSKYECYVKITAVDERIFAIINMKDETQFDCGTVYEVLKYGLDFVHQHFGVFISFALTNTYSSVGALPEAYAQALYLLRYKNSMSIEEPVSINDLEFGAEADAEVIMDGDSEQKLINCIAGGNFENAEIILDRIFENLSGMNLSLEQKQCFMIDLGCMLCKVPKQNIKIDFEKILNYSSNISAMQEFLRAEIKRICEDGSITLNKAGKIEQVKKYIDLKYYEDFDLNSLSYMFHISQNYLSASFKKEVGMPITDYINSVRIKNAKQFLKNTDKPIKDIAEKVGYKNIRTFNRLFQKLEGITPTIYRNNIR